jgi:hypothetical protein
MTNNKLIYFLLILSLSLSPLLYAQNIEKRTPIQVELENEQISITTDRSIYIINEPVQFKAFYSAHEQYKTLHWSTVLYIELIKPDGNPVFQAKYPLTSNGAASSFILPTSILTGNYYLKAYTKWMRNFSTSEYAFHQIKVINPNSPTIAYVEPNDSAINLQAKIKNTESINQLKIHIDSTIKSCRSKIDVSLELPLSEYSENDYCISVVKKLVKSPTIISGSSRFLTTKTLSSIEYYPEINGISISGKLSSKNGIKVSDVNVNLSALNGTKYFASYQTDSIGRFFFNIPNIEGAADFFISSQQDLTITLDDEFCTKPLNIALANENPFTSEEIQLIKNLSINSQITTLFSEPSDTSSTQETALTGFYGQPQIQLFTKDFIELPELKEYFYELIPQFTLKYKKGIPELTTSVWNPFSNYPILLMIDNLEYPDLESFLKINPSRIERIDIVDKGYVVGSSFYSGIINIISKDQDLTGIELPKDSKFFHYKLFAAQEEKQFAKIGSTSVNRRIPDKRNCLYWNPSFKLNSKNEPSFSFYTSDNIGEYEIIVQSISKETGEIETAVKSFRVE